MRDRVLQLDRAQREQTRGSAVVLKTMEAIRGVSEEQARTVRQLEEAIARLQEEAEVLRGEVRRFRL
jgi:methyl-accepting chemotaxis protein